MDFRDYKPKQSKLVKVGEYELFIRSPKSEILPILLDIQRDLDRERSRIEAAKARGEKVSEETIPPETVKKIINAIFLSIKNSYPEKDDKDIKAFIDENLEEIMQDNKYVLLMGYDFIPAKQEVSKKKEQ